MLSQNEYFLLFIFYSICCPETRSQSGRKYYPINWKAFFWIRTVPNLSVNLYSIHSSLGGIFLNTGMSFLYFRFTGSPLHVDCRVPRYTEKNLACIGHSLSCKYCLPPQIRIRNTVRCTNLRPTVSLKCHVPVAIMHQCADQLESVFLCTMTQQIPLIWPNVRSSQLSIYFPGPPTMLQQNSPDPVSWSSGYNGNKSVYLTSLDIFRPLQDLRFCEKMKISTLTTCRWYI
jgi:hypothetical protein